MRTLLFIVTILALLGGTLHFASAITADDEQEARYLGAAYSLTGMTQASLEDLVQMMNSYDGSDQWNRDTIAVIRSWDYFQAGAKDLDAPAKYRTTQKHMESAYAHLVTAGDHYEVGILTQSAGEIEAGNAELALGTDEMGKALDAFPPRD